MAHRFMNVSSNFNFDNLSKLDFAPSALYLLAAPSTPEQARTEALTLAESGEKITHTKAKEIANRHKAELAAKFKNVTVTFLEMFSNRSLYLKIWLSQFATSRYIPFHMLP